MPESEDCVLRAMQTLAREVRRMWGGGAANRRVIGITGSAGKTTTKEMVATVLAARFNVLKSAGNLNNHFGVPLQLLRLEPEHEVAVIEMGMNHAGELTTLAKIAEPDWAVVSNVAAVHLEFFPEGIAGIAKAKYELVQSLPPDGLAFLNADDEYVSAMARGMGDRAVMYGLAQTAQVRATEIEDHGLYGTSFRVIAMSEDDALPVTLHLPGSHNVMNALAAVAVGVQSGMRVIDCLDTLTVMGPTEKRGNLLTWYGASIINDTYNSNPAALRSMIAALAQTPAERRVLIAGEMLELGPEAEAFHRQCGMHAAALGIDVVIGVRGLASELANAATEGGADASFVDHPEAAGEWMRDHLRKGDVVLLKASRGVRLERALDSAWTPLATTPRE